MCACSLLATTWLNPYRSFCYSAWFHTSEKKRIKSLGEYMVNVSHSEVISILVGWGGGKPFSWLKETFLKSYVRALGWVWGNKDSASSVARSMASWHKCVPWTKAQDICCSGTDQEGTPPTFFHMSVSMPLNSNFHIAVRKVPTAPPYSMKH